MKPNTLRITWNSLQYAKSNRDEFRNIKSLDAASKVVSRRIKENIKSAVWTDNEKKKHTII